MATAAELNVDALDDLYEALAELVPPMPPKDAICHIGICEQEKCGNCTRIAAAHAALRKARGNCQ